MTTDLYACELCQRTHLTEGRMDACFHACKRTLRRFWPQRAWFPGRA